MTPSEKREVEYVINKNIHMNTTRYKKIIKVVHKIKNDMQSFNMGNLSSMSMSKYVQLIKPKKMS